MLTDVDGVVTDTFDYDAFGNLIARVGTTPNNYLYSGEQFDPDLNIYFQRARYYNQQRGRFLSMDPFAGFLDEPDTLHKYLYVGNDPVNLTDPSGLAEFSEYAHRVRQKVRDTIVYMRTHGRAILCRTLKTASIILSVAEAENGLNDLYGKALEFALAFCPCKFTPRTPPPGLPRMNPAEILFSQDTVSPNLSKGGTVDDLIGKLKNGLSPDAVEPIRVFQRNGKTYTLDNRRLLAFFYAGVKDIPVVPVDPTDPDIANEIREKFKPINGGKMVVVTSRRGQAEARKLLRKFKKYDPCP